jgi:hypothetical protein
MARDDQSGAGWSRTGIKYQLPHDTDLYEDIYHEEILVG